MTDLLGRQMPRRQFLRITAIAGISLALGGGLTRALLQMAGLRQLRETRTQMGTLVTISVAHTDAAVARQMIHNAFAEMERLEAILSRYHEGTPVSRLNSDGVVRGAPAELVQVVQRALEYSALSRGGFDITVKPLLDLYTSSYARTGQPPTESRVREILALVDYQSVLVDDKTIAFKDRRMSITLDGIAKGHIVDRVLAVLQESGAKQLLVDAGGDMGSVGSGSRGDGWNVAIQSPRDAGSSIGTVHLRGQSVATSGDYLQYFTEDKSLHHILDPRTGRSPEHTSAVTVVAPTAMDADAISTTAFVLGPRDGMQLLDQLDDVEGVIVTKGQDELKSKGFRLYNS